MLLRRRRDLRDTDIAHRPLRAIRRSVARAITAVDTDIADLATQVEEARARAGTLLGCADASLSPRDPGRERALRRSEIELVSGSRCLFELQKLRAVLADTEHRLVRLQEAGSLEIRSWADAPERTASTFAAGPEGEPTNGLSATAEPMAPTTFGGAPERTWPAKARTVHANATTSGAV
ncbi:MAG TPA: hypothetical protein VH414_18780 [Lichenihabitans sp.]|jgi:hypothetical protein|nr:hypothetical protein [Lichenihabitans sp.]